MRQLSLSAVLAGIASILIVLLPLSSCERKVDQSVRSTVRDHTRLSFVENSEGSTSLRAISLRILEREAENCMNGTMCVRDVLLMGGLTKIVGYVVDEQNKDIIFFGEANNSGPPLYLEDFVVALRNAWLRYAEIRGNTHYYSYPGCSIDPDPGVINELQQSSSMFFASSEADNVRNSLERWRSICGKPQNVRVMGVPFDSHFGKVMVGAVIFQEH